MSILWPSADWRRLLSFGLFTLFFFLFFFFFTAHKRIHTNTRIYTIYFMHINAHRSAQTPTETIPQKSQKTHAHTKKHTHILYTSFYTYIVVYSRLRMLSRCPATREEPGRPGKTPHLCARSLTLCLSFVQRPLSSSSRNCNSTARFDSCEGFALLHNRKITPSIVERSCFLFVLFIHES